MGTLVYDGRSHEMDDRLLAHLQIIITAKLQLREPFLVNWPIPPRQGSGRVSLWLAPDIPIEYRFTGSKRPDLNRVWLDALSRASHGVLGLTVMSEREADLRG
jgi:hypothetical protein